MTNDLLGVLALVLSAAIVYAIQALVKAGTV